MVQKLPAGHTHVTVAGVTEKIAQYSGNFYYLKDSLGSVTAIQDSTEHIKQRIEYRTFGSILSIKDDNGADISANPILRASFTFTGREWDDEAGLYYYRARYYDPNIGRFIQKDPHPGQLENPITLVNKYTYAGNSPIVFKDPTGLIFGVDDAVIIGIGAAIGAIATMSNGEWDILQIAVGALVGGGLAAISLSMAQGLELSGATVGPFTSGEFFLLETVTISALKASAQKGNFFTNFIGHYAMDFPYTFLSTAVDGGFLGTEDRLLRNGYAALRPYLITGGLLIGLHNIRQIGCDEDFGGWKGTEQCE